ncbi:hypothetical protein [Thomasclavelia cocleata]|uniref:hypothetical protein n=1 Tax=Thomasclavelia cocleata TaxID=69824 RepID=UPI0024325129|nr:hypothetical protein [Thomasclavelia cocleata]
MSFKYNLNYISGINEYTKRAIYTLVIDKDYFYVNGLIKKKKFSYNQVIKIVYGTTDELKRNIEEVNINIFGNIGLLDRRLNKRLHYCLVIVLENTTIIFAEEHETSIKNAYQKLMKVYEQYH